MCGRAGTQVISKDQLKLAKNVKVLADVNAVPPSGLEGVGLKDDDESMNAEVCQLAHLLQGYQS